MPFSFVSEKPQTKEALIYSASGMKCKEPGAQSSAWPFH
jgi:hypothetical protein